MVGRPGGSSKEKLAARRMNLVRVALAAMLLGGGVILLYLGNRSPIPAAIAGKSRPAHAAASAPQAGDERARQLVLGTWTDDYQGKRTLTVRPDGTATMVIEFDGWKARMFTPRLQIETTWTIEDGRFNRQTIGGEPVDKVEFVKKRVGDYASDEIVKVSADRMVLIDQDGETRYNWRRVR
jgi:hypothetical protein